MILIFLGPPGSGKGTQAKKISAQKKWPQLSTGDMFRSHISQGTKLGLEAKSFMDAGQLVPDAVVIGMIEERITQTDCINGFILDGFPRTIPQADALDEMLSKKKLKVDQVLEFKIKDEELVSRLTGRRTCTKCGAMYHIKTLTPKKDGICDLCAAPIVQRDDDKIEVIQKRLQVYHSQTAPLVQFYSKQQKLKPLDATQSADVVLDKINQLIN